MISLEAQQTILGIKEKIHIRAEDMADKLNITFYPYKKETLSPEILHFKEKLLEEFIKLKVNVVPFADSLERTPLKKIFRRLFRITINNLGNIFGMKNHYVPFAAIINLLRVKKIKTGISVIALGENNTWNLPMDHTSSFTKSSVITIVDLPKNINAETTFSEHFDTAMTLFAYHMTNIVIGVTKKDWILYNFNASHPTYNYSSNFQKGILHGLIPKIVAPIRPHVFSDFIKVKEHFNPEDSKHKAYSDDLVESGKTFAKTKLFPPGKKIDDLPFRNKFYLWVGKIHLDERNGMSYGFLARQMPTDLPDLIPIEIAKKDFPNIITDQQDWFFHDEKLFIIIDVKGKPFVLKVPDVWVLSQRSGCDKTNMNPTKDLVKLGLCNGKMYIQTPEGLELTNEYKPSFDTTVILAHAVGNSIIASIKKHLDKSDSFAQQIEDSGYAISHWHGYFNQKFIPDGWHIHGYENPNVSCSSPQSAIYALGGKLECFNLAQQKKIPYKGDIHVEPHHGSNICYPTLKSLGELIINNAQLTSLGNQYLTT